MKKLHHQLKNQVNSESLIIHYYISLIVLFNSLQDKYNQGVSLEFQTKLKHEFEHEYPKKTIKSNPIYVLNRFFPYILF